MSDENEKKPDLGLTLLRWGAPELFVEPPKPEPPKDDKPPEPTPEEQARHRQAIFAREQREAEREAERAREKLQRSLEKGIKGVRAQLDELQADAWKKFLKGKNKKGKRS